MSALTRTNIAIAQRIESLKAQPKEIDFEELELPESLLELRDLIDQLWEIYHARRTFKKVNAQARQWYNKAVEVYHQKSTFKKVYIKL